MDVAAIEQAVRDLKPEIASLGVRSLMLVGSAARDELGPESDVDFVVEFNGPATFMAFMDLVELLEAAIDRPIDLTTLKAVRPEIASDLLAGARRVA